MIGTGMSAEDRARRRLTLGSSEVAAVMGVSPYQSEHTVWLAKVKGVEFEGNEATHLGNLVEPTIAAIYADRYGKTLTKGVYTIGPEPWMSCTPDYLIDGERGISEAKLVGFRTIWMWGPGNTDEQESDAAPMHYLVQAMWQLAVTGLEYVDLSALMGTEFRTYRIRRNESLIATMVDRCRAWWHAYITTETPPPVDGSEGATEMLRNLYPRSGGDPVEASPELEELAAKLAAARAAYEAAEAERRLRENEIKSMLKDASGAYGNGWRIRYAAQKNGRRPFVFELKDDRKVA